MEFSFDILGEGDGVVNEEEKEKEWYLSTSDNPYNFFSEYEKWEEFDIHNGYNTNALIASLAPYNPHLTDELNREEFDDAMRRIYEWYLPFINSYGEEVHYIKCYEE